MIEHLSCEVLIVGLGPVGATLAALLTDSCVDVIAIDKSTEVYPLPRAAHFDGEIMRIFQQLGIADEVRRHANPATGYEFRTADGEVLVSFGDMANTIGPAGWPEAFMFNQPGLERALRAKLQASSHARIRLGAVFERVTSRDGGVDVEIVVPDGRLAVRARYVVGCDGARSSVRETIGSKLSDYQFDEPWLVIDAIPHEGAQLPEVNLQICDPARPVTCVRMGPGRHRWEFMLLPGETAEQVLHDDFIKAQLAKWNVDLDIERKAVYRFHARVAERWRAGPVLIAGDAAHETPPFAGQGMCAGIRDAANLAWKLTAVLHGRADDALLDSYQVEREPNARAYIALAVEMGRVVCTLDPGLARLRNENLLAARRAGVSAIPPASPPPHKGPAVLVGSPAAGLPFPQPVASGDDGPVRLDDVLGADAWLIAAPGFVSPASQGLTLIGLEEGRVAPFRDQLAAWLAKAGAEAVLVRPDRYVFGTGAVECLVAAWAAALKSQAAASDCSS